MLSRRHRRRFTQPHRRKATSTASQQLQCDHLLQSNPQTKTRYGLANAKKQVHHHVHWRWSQRCQHDQHCPCRHRHKRSGRSTSSSLLRLCHLGVSNRWRADSLSRKVVLQKEFTTHSLQLLQKSTPCLATILVRPVQQLLQRQHLWSLGEPTL